MSSNLLITEIMYNPGSHYNDDYGWIELYNNSSQPIDLTGYVYDLEGGYHFFNPIPYNPNILSGVIQPYSTGILYSTVTTSGFFGNELTPIDRLWDPSGTRNINFIPVTIAQTQQDFYSRPAGLGLQPGSRIGIWSSSAAYANRNFANAIIDVRYFDGGQNFPSSNNASSIYLTSLNANPNLGSSWRLSTPGQAGAFSVNANVIPGIISPDPQGTVDIGSPGFVPFAAPPPPPTIRDGIFNFQQFARTTSAVRGPLAYTPVEVGGLKLPLLYDETYYLSKNQDVANAVSGGALRSGYDHFVQNGWLEGRSPSILFDEAYYLSQNPDVNANVGAGKAFSSGFQHFVLAGNKEGRNPSEVFNQQTYLTSNPDIQGAITSGVFTSGFDHWLEFGASEGRGPRVSLFDEAFYLRQNTDVAPFVGTGKAFSDGLQHYLSFGAREGRNPSALFTESSYLSQNPDVAAAVTAGAFPSGFVHYVLNGRGEGRAISAVV